MKEIGFAEIAATMSLLDTWFVPNVNQTGHTGRSSLVVFLTLTLDAGMAITASFLTAVTTRKDEMVTMSAGNNRNNKSSTTIGSSTFGRNITTKNGQRKIGYKKNSMQGRFKDRENRSEKMRNRCGVMDFIRIGEANTEEFLNH